MQSHHNLPALLTMIAAEAATIIQCEASTVIRYSGISRRVEEILISGPGRPLVDLVRAAAQERWLITPGSVPDLTVDPRWASRPYGLAAANWRAVLTVPLISPSPPDQIRLSWLSDAPYAFANQVAVADLFCRHVNLAIQAAQKQTSPIG